MSFEKYRYHHNENEEFHDILEASCQSLSQNYEN